MQAFKMRKRAYISFKLYKLKKIVLSSSDGNVVMFFSLLYTLGSYKLNLVSIHIGFNCFVVQQSLSGRDLKTVTTNPGGLIQLKVEIEVVKACVCNAAFFLL